MAATRVLLPIRVAGRIAGLPFRATVTAIDGGLAIERRTRTMLKEIGEQLALDALDALLTGDAIDRVLERIEAAGIAQRIARRILDDGIAEEVVTLLLESEELWVLVDEIARSPSVTEAITHQGAGFVDQVSDTVRDRSREADAWIERAARRLKRRPKSTVQLAGIEETLGGEAPLSSKVSPNIGAPPDPVAPPPRLTVKPPSPLFPTNT